MTLRCETDGGRKDIFRSPDDCIAWFNDDGDFCLNRDGIYACCLDAFDEWWRRQRSPVEDEPGPVNVYDLVQPYCVKCGEAMLGHGDGEALCNCGGTERIRPPTPPEPKMVRRFETAQGLASRFLDGGVRVAEFAMLNGEVSLRFRNMARTPDGASPVFKIHEMAKWLAWQDELVLAPNG